MTSVRGPRFEHVLNQSITAGNPAERCGTIDTILPSFPTACYNKEANNMFKKDAQLSAPVVYSNLKNLQIQDKPNLIANYDPNAPKFTNALKMQRDMLKP